MPHAKTMNKSKKHEETKTAKTKNRREKLNFQRYVPQLSHGNLFGRAGAWCVAAACFGLPCFDRCFERKRFMKKTHICLISCCLERTIEVMLLVGFQLVFTRFLICV